MMCKNMRNTRQSLSTHLVVVKASIGSRGWFRRILLNKLNLILRLEFEAQFGLNVQGKCFDNRDKTNLIRGGSIF